MRFTLVSALVISMVSTFHSVAQAGEKFTIGTARILTNDYLGDGKDRWRSGSYAISKMRASEEWDGAFPDEIGAMLEWRFRMDILAPSNIVRRGDNDRRYAGTLTFGLHTYFNRNSVDYSLGLDLVAVGPSTGVGSFQRTAHRVLGAPKPGDEVLATQMSDDIMPTLSGSASQQIRFSGSNSLRPFAEFRIGDETFARIGADFHFGNVGQNDLWLRDIGTGQAFRATFERVNGVSFLVGGDVAFVESSKYLPPEDGVTLNKGRVRARAGMHWQGEQHSIFYGLTYLGKEFDEQSEGQFVGSVALRRRF